MPIVQAESRAQAFQREQALVARQEDSDQQQGSAPESALVPFQSPAKNRQSRLTSFGFSSPEAGSPLASPQTQRGSRGLAQDSVTRAAYYQSIIAQNEARLAAMTSTSTKSIIVDPSAAGQGYNLNQRHGRPQGSSVTYSKGHKPIDAQMLRRDPTASQRINMARRVVARMEEEGLENPARFARLVARCSSRPLASPGSSWSTRSSD